VPELPEVEVVRRGLAEHVVGRTVISVEVRHLRAVRRHIAGAEDFAARLHGATVASANRRGKYLWLALHGRDDAVMAHLGMSGQLLIRPPHVADEIHLRIRLRLDDGNELRFVDQRTFGGLSVEELTPDGVPMPVAHIARDPFDPQFDLESVVQRLRQRNTGVKRALLDQTLVSGIGNIYADEALWRARLHWARPTSALTRPAARRLLIAAADVMTVALGEGGTSFDSLYVNVNGQSGYFDRSLAVYGQHGRPCPRCGTTLRREVFVNRSSYYCPRCQPCPRRPHV
jgi:formamidopyrimidine-DNA glycosylase